MIARTKPLRRNPARNASAGGGMNCGTGHGGFKPGNTCAAGGSRGAGGAVSFSDGDGNAAALRAQVMPGVSDAQLGKMVCAPPGATVSMFAASSGALVCAFSHEGVRARRSFRRDSGDLVCKNVDLSIEPSSPHKGSGYRLFADQVQALKQGGVRRVTTEAAGDYSDKNINGYYTWARLGYDGQVPPRASSRMPEQFKQMKTIQQVMATPEGRAAWKAKGEEFLGTFDLTPGSTSLKVLSAYVAEREGGGG